MDLIAIPTMSLFLALFPSLCSAFLLSILFSIGFATWWQNGFPGSYHLGSQKALGPLPFCPWVNTPPKESSRTTGQLTYPRGKKTGPQRKGRLCYQKRGKRYWVGRKKRCLSTHYTSARQALSHPAANKKPSLVKKKRQLKIF